MTVTIPTLDTAKPPGEKLAPEMRDEIVVVAPSQLAPGDVTTTKIADDAVTAPKIAAGAVGSSEIATGAVASAELAAGAVVTAKIADEAVTGAKAGVGVLAVKDSAGNYIDMPVVFLTEAQFTSLGGGVDSATLYLRAP